MKNQLLSVLLYFMNISGISHVRSQFNYENSPFCRFNSSILIISGISDGRSQYNYENTPVCRFNSIFYNAVWNVRLYIFKTLNSPQVFIRGCRGRFGRGASLYRFRSQLFVRLWARLPLPIGQFSEIEFSAYNVRRGWFTVIELVSDPTTLVHFLPVPLDLIV